MTCPITSIPNPINKDELYLFYLTGQNKYSAGLEIHNYATGSDAVVNFQDNGIPTPAVNTNTIINPGAFTSVLWNNMLNVYGMVRDPANATAQGAESTATDPKRLAQLSPVFNIIGDKQVAAARGLGLATLVDGSNQGYLYTFNANTAADAYVIKVIRLGYKASAAPSTVNPGSTAASNSQLAAVHNPADSKSLVFYQDAKKGSIRMIHVNGSDAEFELPNTNDSRKGTGLAALAIKTEAGYKLVLYYFADNGGNTQRIVRNEKGKWGSSGALDEGDNPVESAETSYLTASIIKNKVVLFYVAKDKPGFFTQEDKIEDL